MTNDYDLEPYDSAPECCNECGSNFFQAWWQTYIEDDEGEDGYGLLVDYICYECDHEWQEYYQNYSEYG